METRKCHVENCSSNNQFFQFFPLPEDPILKRKWEIRTRNKNPRICEKHFSFDCFERDMRSELFQVKRKNIKGRCSP